MLDKLASEANETKADIRLPNMNQHQVCPETYGKEYIEKSISMRQKMQKCSKNVCSPCSGLKPFIKAIASFFPILSWLPSYDFRANLPSDIVGGLTIGIMHVPSGIAFAALAKVDIVYGLYANCFPALFYMFFGTSRQASIGAHAVIALMAGVANDNIMHAYGRSISNTSSTPDVLAPTSIEVASTLTFVIGAIQVLSGVLRLEFLASYLSAPLISGFATASAVHIIVSQIDGVLGIVTPSRSGPFYLFKRVQDTASIAWTSTNWACVIVSVPAFVFLIGGREHLSPYLNRRFRLPFPIPYELILVIITTAISKLLDLERHYDVGIVGNIPTGLPPPVAPRWDLLATCLGSSIRVTIVATAIHLTMAKMLARQANYELDSRQELYALGASSVFGSFFSVYPITLALAQTMINVACGTKTQLCALFSCLLLVVVICWLGPLLNTLPTCILATIMIVAMKRLFHRTDELRNLWRISKIDLLVWVVAFVSTVVIDVMEGLALSVLCALLTVIIRSQWPNSLRTVGFSPEEPSRESSDVPREAVWSQPKTVAAFAFDGPVIFTNVERFTAKARQTAKQWEQFMERHSATQLPQIRFFILDCAAIGYVDSMGAQAMDSVVNEMSSRGFTVHLVGARPSILRALDAQGTLKTLGRDHLFRTQSDALSIEGNNASPVPSVYLTDVPDQVQDEIAMTSRNSNL